MYQVCSEARGVADPVCVDMPVTYALHPDMHEPGMPMNVMAEVVSDTEIMVSWETPVDDGGSAITGFKVMYKMTGSTGDYMSMDAAADATSATVSGLMAATEYTFKVIATNAHGDSYASMMAMEMTYRANTAPMAGDAIR